MIRDEYVITYKVELAKREDWLILSLSSSLYGWIRVDDL